MSRAAADRPSRRLDAILGTLRKHGVRTFRAASLPGIGDGIAFELGDVPAERPEAPNDAPSRSGHLSRFSPREPGPVD